MDLLPNVELLEPSEPEPEPEPEPETEPEPVKKESPFKREEIPPVVPEKLELENEEVKTKPPAKKNKNKRIMTEKQLEHMAKMRELAAKKRNEKIKNGEITQKLNRNGTPRKQYTRKPKPTKPEQSEPTPSPQPPPSPQPKPQPSPQKYIRTDEEVLDLVDKYLEAKERKRAAKSLEQKKVEEKKVEQKKVEPKVFNPFNYDNCF